MRTQVWLIDDNGFYQNESKFVEKVLENMTTVPLLVGYVKPKLVDDEWIEGATEEEVQEWKETNKLDILPFPTVEERLGNLEALTTEQAEYAVDLDFRLSMIEISS